MPFFHSGNKIIAVTTTTIIVVVAVPVAKPTRVIVFIVIT